MLSPVYLTIFVFSIIQIMWILSLEDKHDVIQCDVDYLLPGGDVEQAQYLAVPAGQVLDSEYVLLALFIGMVVGFTLQFKHRRPLHIPRHQLDQLGLCFEESLIGHKQCAGLVQLNLVGFGNVFDVCLVVERLEHAAVVPAAHLSFGELHGIFDLVSRFSVDVAAHDVQSGHGHDAEVPFEWDGLVGAGFVQFACQVVAAYSHLQFNCIYTLIFNDAWHPALLVLHGA